ncbi:MAG TPA: hypothetical protein VI685_15095, partial [Candidatus Angelobacter sp.]
LSSLCSKFACIRAETDLAFPMTRRPDDPVTRFSIPINLRTSRGNLRQILVAARLRRVSVLGVALDFANCQLLITNYFV